MQTEQEIQDAAKSIVSFTDSYVQNKQRKQKEQSESESTPSLAQVTSSLESLLRQIEMNNSSKQVIQIPKLLQSLITLSRYKVETHFSQVLDRQRLQVRHCSRDCLNQIQVFGDEQVQTDLVNNGYGRIMSITFSTAGGVGEEQNQMIINGLNLISWFLRVLYEGRNDQWYLSFQPLPLLARRTEEQIEEEGANEEIDTQMKNIGLKDRIKMNANYAKAAMLNHFINKR
ncbi:MAG: hypothetical protein EZS28_035693 [Streblomastix strix]|uniref:Uncharacterized protein n=1 Tax=Streblomastix strix TaxID=222440 RepID=A0A5J4UDT4_9EUKA|nr:MAG: hypothetical protein EZS28_035693 [Streblomastix strix]